MRKRLLFLLALIVCGFASVWADEVTPEQAREIALKFMKSHSSRRAAPAMEQPVKVSGLYVFNMSNNGGYVIVSNDDQTTPILGFSDSGSIDPDNMPSNMRAWLQGYADEIAWLQKNQNNGTIASPATDKARRRTGTQKSDIDKLISTTWDQVEPYNNMAPYYGKSNNQYVYSKDNVNGYSHCATGCVATSMAQVMFYHRWPNENTDPNKLVAIPAYQWKSNIWLPDQNTSLALTATTFEWNKMLRTYVENNQVLGTDEEKNAIATLMKYCGYSLKMDYGPSSSSDNGMLADALKTYFNYKNTTQVVSRSLYSYDKWIDLIYYELQNRRPVIYGGQSTRGGHSFICDGYENIDGTDYFHINWGWGGQSDDFYVLSVLNPYNGQGTGGSSSNDGFRYDQDAVIGIQKFTDTGEMSGITPNIINLTMNSMTLSHSSVVVRTKVTATLNITNNNATDYDGTIYIGYKSGGTYYLLEGDNFYIRARETKDCVLEFTPTGIGTYNLYLFLPNTYGSYSTDETIWASLPVVASGQGTPTNLAVTGVTSNSAQLSWTENGEATAWKVGIKANGANDFTTIDAKVNPFTLAELSPETNYTVKVRQSDNENWSPEFTFTTPTAYPVPENLTVSEVTPTSALISWTGNAESYNVRYGELPAGLSAESKWLQYDNGGNTGGYGNETSQTWTWGIMYPGDQVTGNKLTKVMLYKRTEGTNPITIKIYRGGSNEPGTQIGIKNFTPSNTQGFQTVQFDTPISITPGENLWITLTETGIFQMAYSSGTSTGLCWYYNNVNWVDSKLIWMIRGYIETDLNSLSWSESVNRAESSYELKELDAAKNYAVQVRSHYSSGNSDWVTATINKAFELSNNGANNGNLVEAWNAIETNVTLKGRTLFKDGSWNTICLPFSLSSEQLASSPLAGAEIRTLSSATLNDGELTLYFTPETGEGSVTSITAGTPYIIKWDKAEGYESANVQTRDIKDPVFSSVTIDKTVRDITSNNIISFKGTYVPLSFTSSDESTLFLGDNNMLYYPKSGARLGACRAYFQIGSDLARSFVLNFGDDSATGIIAIGNSQLSTPNSQISDWYTLDGRKLNGKPTAKGVYVKNGQKIVIK